MPETLAVAGAELGDDPTRTERPVVPTASPFHIARPRLVEALGQVTAAPVVLVSGPAGSGKSALLAEWLRTGATRDDELAWITCQDEDTLLWQPLLACLAERGLPVPSGALQTHMGPLLGTARLPALAASIGSSGRRWTLVVDGFELRSPELAAEVSFLLDHAEGRIRLVLAARVDPVLPLYRYRLEDSICEVRATDLSFTDAEAGLLLERCGVPLPAKAVHELNARLGGWAAGLRFAARALARHPRPVDSAAALVGQDTDIKEYLLAEVLRAQSPETRTLLLHTCVPDVLVPGLIEELAGPDGPRELADLVAANLFLEPVPEQQDAYLYRPFFRDLLRAQLAYEDPTTSADLHRRAASWLRDRELWARSVGQLATGGLWPDVARQLVEDLLVGRLLAGQDQGLREIARRIPADTSDPATCIVRAAMALSWWDRATCGEELDRARTVLGATPTTDEPRGLSFAVVDAVRACTADATDAAAETLDRAAQALSAARRPAACLAAPELEGLVETAGGLIALRRGELVGARACFERAEALPGLPGRLRSAVRGYQALTDALDGQLSRARRLGLEAESVAQDSGLPAPLRNPAAVTALALVALERGDLAAARDHLRAARARRGLVGDPVSRTVADGVLAHVEAASGDGRVALARLESVCDRSGVADPWLAGWLRIQAAELAVAHGLPEHALRVVDALTPQDSPAGQVVAAAAYAEQGRSVALGRSLAQARELPQPLPSEVTRLLVEGVRESRRHSPREATPLVEQALALAAQEGARRPFTEAPPAVRELLADHPALLDRHGWLTGEDRPLPAEAIAEAGPSTPAPRDTAEVGQLVVEPLTAREREVLGHLEELLTTQEIAEKMFVSVNTVRTHVRSILRKLGVNRRNSAVRRARALGLFEPPLATAGAPPRSIIRDG